MGVKRKRLGRVTGTLYLAGCFMFLGVQPGTGMRRGGRTMQIRALTVPK
jgi:hypothetical protein